MNGLNEWMNENKDECESLKTQCVHRHCRIQIQESTKNTLQALFVLLPRLHIILGYSVPLSFLFNLL